MLIQDNVLIDSDGNPKLCDFGLSRALEDTSLWQTTTKQAPGTLRWQSPELLSSETARVTIQSDIYAFGMTCLVRPLFPLSVRYES